jgi:hypothetical protein
LETQAGVTVEWIALRQGLLRFEDSHNSAIDNITVNVSGNGECKKHLLAWPGRLGINAPVALETDAAERLMRFVSETAPQDFASLPAHSSPILVLGTGECNAPAYLLGRELERRGFKVKVQSTTRSPIHPGNDIASVCRFEDNYDDGIANFIYNLNPDDYREIIICHETPLSGPLLECLREWRAVSAKIELNPPSTDAKLHFFRP